jgi:hypothetical protein
MATEIHDKDYVKRLLFRAFVVMGVLMLVGLLIIPTVILTPQVSGAGYGVMTSWGLVLIAGTTWLCRVQYRYCCPRCGKRLPPVPSGAGNKFEHRFHCAFCDVVWTTSVYDGD